MDDRHTEQRRQHLISKHLTNNYLPGRSLTERHLFTIYITINDTSVIFKFPISINEDIR